MEDAREPESVGSEAAGRGWRGEGGAAMKKQSKNFRDKKLPRGIGEDEVLKAPKIFSKAFQEYLLAEFRGRNAKCSKTVQIYTQVITRIKRCAPLGKQCHQG